MSELGEIEGMFWMSFTDFFYNFRHLFVCAFFEEEWEEKNFKSEWSIAKRTAGGCAQETTCIENP